PFTLTESVISETTADSITAITPTIKYITYVGYNPHLHLDTTSVNGTDTGVNNQAGNTNNQTNEGPVDGGIPLYDLNAAGDPATGTDVVQKGMVSYIKDLTGLDFIELGLIDVADTVYGTGNAADLSNMTFTNATTGTQTITINTGDGTVNTAEVSISQEYFALLHDMFFDAEGNSRLYEVERKTWPKVALTDQNGNTVKDSAGAIILVDLYQYTSHGVTTHTYPIVLTTEHNNGGTLETGLTSNGDDTIVAGRLELLHQAYIDGGAGHNILEIDAKGTYAQPAELLNIQEVRVHDLPNFYTIASGDGNLENTAVNGTGFLNPVNTASGSGDDSWIDLTRATAIEKLVVTDGTNGSGGSGSSDPDYSGNLTIVGVRNGATLRLEGAFNSGSTTIQYGEGQTGPLEIELAIGDVKTPIILLQNAAVLHIDSQGVENHMHVFFAGGTVSQMIITGTGAFGVEEDLHAGFNTEQPILIDASANTGGVNLNLTGSQNVTFKGSIADDTFRVNTAEMSNPSPNGYFAHENDHSVTIVDTAGDNHYEVSTYAAAITANGDGNNNFEVSAAVADLKAGDGNNDFELSVGALTLEAGNGNNTVEIVSDYISSTTAPSGSADVVSNIDITFGNGKNVIDVEQDLASTYEGHVNITVGDGGNDIDVVGGRNVAITTGSGDDLIRVVTDKLTINSGAGNDTITIVGADTDYTATYGDGLLFNINTGTGSATINLGSTQSEMNPDGVNDFPYDGYVVAHEGSSITGADITLFVNTIADLSAIKPQNLTGVTKVILDDDNSLYSGSPQANDNTTSATFTALVTSYNAALTAYTTLSDSTTQAQLVQKYDDLDKLISGLTHSDGLDAVTGDTAAQALQFKV
ncbi:MAG: hypothetical protein JZU70_00370, partial [Chlorobium sp.]|nr:hypothetical protein [Chlorobium sp.]